LESFSANKTMLKGEYSALPVAIAFSNAAWLVATLLPLTSIHGTPLHQ